MSTLSLACSEPTGVESGRPRLRMADLWLRDRATRAHRRGPAKNGVIGTTKSSMSSMRAMSGPQYRQSGKVDAMGEVKQCPFCGSDLVLLSRSEEGGE